MDNVIFIAPLILPAVAAIASWLAGVRRIRSFAFAGAASGAAAALIVVVIPTWASAHIPGWLFAIAYIPLGALLAAGCGAVARATFLPPDGSATHL